MYDTLLSEYKLYCIIRVESQSFYEARHAAREDRTRYSIEAREGAIPSITVKKASIVELARAAMVLCGWRTG